MTVPQQIAVAFYEALNAEDFATVQDLLAPGVVGKISDVVAAQTEHQGADALVNHLRRRRSLGEGSYRVDGWAFHDHPMPDVFASVEIRHSAVYAGERIASVCLHVLRVDDGRIGLLAASLPEGEVDGRWLGLVA